MGVVADVLFWMGMVCGGVYGVVLLVLGSRLSKVRREQQFWKLSEKVPKVSILVAFRNEEKNISQLLNGIQNQAYPANSLEIILVDDHSEDDGLKLVLDWQKHHPECNLLVLYNGANETGKKAAIRKGSQQATGEFLLMTDADCLLHPNWVNEMIITQQETTADLVCGAVKIKKSHFWQNLEGLETAALMAVAATGIRINKPNFCNAANLMVRRQDYLAVEKTRTDFGLASGDDVFLLHQFHKNGKKLAYCLTPFSGIVVMAKKSMAELIQQRLRWASKWKSGLDGGNMGLAVGVWLFHLMYLGLIILGLATQKVSDVGLLILFKTATELYFMETFTEEYGRQNSGGWVFIFQPIYSLYVLYMGLRVLFSRQYVWKGRKVSF